VSDNEGKSAYELITRHSMQLGDLVDATTRGDGAFVSGRLVKLDRLLWHAIVDVDGVHLDVEPDTILPIHTPEELADMDETTS